MRTKIRAVHKKTEQESSFTLEQWENLERTGHAGNWKIIDDSALVAERAEKVPDVEFKTWATKLEEEGIEYNKSIKNPDKLKVIYELATKEKEAEKSEDNTETTDNEEVK